MGHETTCRALLDEQFDVFATLSMRENAVVITYSVQKYQFSPLAQLFFGEATLD